MNNLILTSAIYLLDINSITIINNAGYYLYKDKKTVLRLVSSKNVASQIKAYSDNGQFAETAFSILEVEDFYPSQAFINYLKDLGEHKYVRFLKEKNE